MKIRGEQQMKKPFLLLIILLLLSLLIYWYLTHEPKGVNMDGKDIDVVVIETNLEINVEDVINAFNVTNRVYFHNKEEIPILNKVEPAAFYYLDGALLTYTFENEVECNKAVEFIHENFTYEKLLASRLVEFRQTDFEPIIYKVNNALIVYIPKYTIRTKMNRSVERVIFLKKAGEKGLTKEMLNCLGNLGFSNQEILELPQSKIDTIFAPGAHLDGGGFDFSALSEEEQKELQKSGIDSYKSVILNNLGYEYEDMTNISKAELDLIFPNMELVAKLEELGLTKKDIEEKLNNGLNYKDIIKEVLNF